MSDQLTRGTGDVFNLERFEIAQLNTYSKALSEITQGRKTSHWMWFIFPQVKGLGRSYESRLYAISSLNEAIDYLSHDVLGERLRECVSVLQEVSGRSAREIFGPIDEMKLRSSLTLFNAASREAIFEESLKKYFDGKHDEMTLSILQSFNKL